jgi:hypothetical protein
MLHEPILVSQDTLKEFKEAEDKIILTALESNKEIKKRTR